MDPWQKDTLGLKVGDWIIWQDEAIEVEGQPAGVTSGMKGSTPTACFWDSIMDPIEELWRVALKDLSVNY